MTHHQRTQCRLCGSKKLTQGLSLTPTPLANAFIPASHKNKKQPTYPLNLWFCHQCSHIQLLDVIDPHLLFHDYVYVSGTSPVFVDHFQRYATAMIQRFDLGPDNLVVEIGSNDGTLLRFFQQQGLRVIGIDPAEKIAKTATESGIPTLNHFFTPHLAQQIVEQHKSANLIVANNVYAHMDDLHAVTLGIKKLLDPQGVFVFEVSYWRDVYQKTLFDTIYHEHLDYHTLTPLPFFFKQFNLRVFDAQRIDTHGGSLRVMVCPEEALWQTTPQLTQLLDEEKALKLDQLETLQSFAEKIDRLGKQLQKILKKSRKKNRRIAAFGAPAKATTLMYQFGITPEMIDFIVDDSPLKQGLFSPGMHIPVYPSTAIEEQKPDDLLILAWNFAESIIKKNPQFLQQGGRFIIPLPEPSIVTHE
ncbi:methyltransferase domain-containing protein [Magnetococcales bacterium HHB-1]